METPGIVLIGDSPGIYVCAIYLHTANVPFTLFRKNLSLQYNCRFVPGIPNIDSDDFNERCMRQAEGMGIEVITANDLDVEAQGAEFRVVNDSDSHVANVLVLDTGAYLLESRDNLFLISNKVRIGEAIDVAGAGCKTAFMVREYLE